MSWVLISACYFIPERTLERRLDQDGDGIIVSEDCDDTDAGVGGEALWFSDSDGDGYGSGVSISGCIRVRLRRPSVPESPR